MNTRISTEIKTKILKDYLKGKKVYELCLKYSVKKSSVYNWIKQSKSTQSQQNLRISDEKKSIIINLLTSGMTVKEIVKSYDVKSSTVYNWYKYKKSSKPDVDNVSQVSIEKLRMTIKILKESSIMNSFTTREKLNYIHTLSASYPIITLCETYDINRSSYYAFIKQIKPPHIERDSRLKIMIKEIYLRHKKRIGALKIKQDLLIQNEIVSIKKIYQLMAILHIKAIKITKKPFVVIHKRKNGQFKNYLKQQFNPVAPNIVWASDITEIKINQKSVYLCIIMDLFSRKIISYQVSRKNNTRLTIMTINQAFKDRMTKPNMFHSDRGVQFTSISFREIFQKNQIIQSFSAAGYPYDNAPVESFFSTFKRETVHQLLPFKTIQSYIKMVDEYIFYYNQKRFHLSNQMLTPSDKELNYFKNNL